MKLWLSLSKLYRVRCKILPKSVPFFMALGYSNDLLPRLPTSTQRKKIKHQACIKIPVVYRTVQYVSIPLGTLLSILQLQPPSTIHHPYPSRHSIQYRLGLHCHCHSNWKESRNISPLSHPINPSTIFHADGQRRYSIHY